MKLPAIYPITDRRISGLPHDEQIRRLAGGGARLVQLREKHATSREFFEFALAAIEAARPFGTLVVINDRVDIALAAEADGVHLGQDDLSPAEARKLLGNRAIIGISTHNADQAVAALEMPVDYIAIGPVFRTSTKESPEPEIGLEGIRQVRSAIGEFPLVAIGGIDADSLRHVLSAGADSAAVVRAVLDPPGSITENLSRLADRSR